MDRVTGRGRSKRQPAARRAAGALLLAAVLGLAACASKRSGDTTYKDPSLDLDLVQTAAVLPFVNLCSDDKAADRVRDVFSTMLQATGRVYVVPPGETAKAMLRTQTGRNEEPSTEVIMAVGKAVKAEVVITGVLREYGLVRSGNSQANAIALSIKLYESEGGKLIWSGSTSEGGVTMGDRFLGGGGEPMEKVTEEAVETILDQMFP